MSQTIEIRVPDIGDFKDVPVIEVLVKTGDRVKKNDSLITLESEKASMEVPAETEGVVQDVKVKVGDKVSQRSPILVLSSAAAAAQEPAAPSPAPSANVPAAPVSSPPSPAPSPAPQPEPAAPAAGDGMVHAGPSVRRFARELGVDLHKLIELIQASMVRSGVVDYKAPFVLRRDYSPNFPLRLMHKDIHLMLDMAKENRVKLPALETVDEIYELSTEEGWENLDYAATLALLEKWAGLGGQPKQS